MSMPERILMGPGPSTVSARVLRAMSQPTVGHLDPLFLRLMDRVRERLKQVFVTENEMTLAVSGTGSAGMETLFVNLVEPGDKVLVLQNGVFGARMRDVAARCGATVVAEEKAWGSRFSPAEIMSAIERERPAVVALVQAETSTGVHQPVAGIAELIHQHGGLLLVDCVTSFAGMPVTLDEWGIDAAYTGTQKCLSCPPGLSPISLSPRAVDRLNRRTRPVQSWYLDLSMVQRYWGKDRVYHHTAPVNMLYALDEALAVVLEEGLEARFSRHRRVHERLACGLEEMGIGYLSDPADRLPMLNAIAIPDGAVDATVRLRLLEEYGLEIGAGLGEFAGKAWRIGLMGHAATERNVELLLAALRRLLSHRGGG